MSLLSLALILSGSLAGTVPAAESAQSSNPISRVARLFNPKLAEIEDRMSWLQSRLRGLSVYAPKPLQNQFGWRAGRIHPELGDPWITLDLGGTFPLSDLYLVPAQPLPGETNPLFPLRFRIETALSADFSDSREVFATGDEIFQVHGAYPVRIQAREIDARYVRLSVQQGHFRGAHDIATLSEIFIFSGGEPVSLNATVTANQSMDTGPSWNPRYATDGRTPLGIWEGGNWTKSRGDAFDVTELEQQAEWIIDLGEARPVDRVVLYPYSMPELGGNGALPDQIQIELTSSPEERPTAAAASIPGGESSTPLTIPFQGKSGRFLVLRSNRALGIGPRWMQALSEIEVWSQGRNLAEGRPVVIRHLGKERRGTVELTDGYANGLKLFPLDRWLSQLHERSLIEHEQASLGPIRTNMATESELHATWAASIGIGLTFLIPVALVERRRLVSRNQIDKLRNRIASDLHDDIGSNLGSISLIARSAKRDLQRSSDPQDVAEDLAEVEMIARESSLAMRDIVWLLERRADSIGDFVQRMRDTASRLLRSIDYQLVCRSNRTALKLTLDAKRHLFLWYKEALHNVLKHSQATEVRIKVYDSRDRIVMEVRDNGIGLPTGDDARPAAVRKLTDRAEVLGGELEVESEPGTGTLLRLAVKKSNLIASKAAA